MCYSPKKVLEVILHLLNSETGHIHTMNLIKCLLNKESREHSLVIIKEVFWGKNKIDYCAKYQGIALTYILKIVFELDSTIVLEEILKIVEESKNPTELALVEEIRYKITHKAFVA